MTPAQSIADLDAAIARRGESITMKRGATSVTVKALVRGKSAGDLPGTDGQMHWTIIVSPTSLGALGVPKLGDTAVIKGKECEVSVADPIHMGSALVRVNLEAAG